MQKDELSIATKPENCLNIIVKKKKENQSNIRRLEMMTCVLQLFNQMHQDTNISMY